MLCSCLDGRWQPCVHRSWLFTAWTFIFPICFSTHKPEKMLPFNTSVALHSQPCLAVHEGLVYLQSTFSFICFFLRFWKCNLFANDFIFNMLFLLCCIVWLSFCLPLWHSLPPLSPYFILSSPFCHRKVNFLFKHCFANGRCPCCCWQTCCLQ